MRQSATRKGLKRRAYLRSDFLQAMIDDGNAAYDALIWDVMMLELWFRERAAPMPQNQHLSRLVA
jgi:hypothetical protein